MNLTLKQLCQKKSTSPLLLFFFLTLFMACGGTDPVPPVNTFTFGDEKNLGAAIHQAMLTSDNFSFLHPDNSEYDYCVNYIRGLRVKFVGSKLMERTSDFDWNIYVLKNDNIKDCFNTVGGNFYIYSGLLKSLQNEAQFMSVLAHEFYYADVSYNRFNLQENYSLSILLDVSYGGENEIAMEMLNSFYNTPRKPTEVEVADQYGFGLLCLVGQKGAEMKTMIQDAHQSNNTWYINHKEPSNNWSDRLDFFTDRSCAGTIVNPGTYATFLGKLDN